MQNLIKLEKLWIRGNPLISNPDSKTESILKHLKRRVLLLKN